MSDEPERLDAPNQQVVRPDGSGPAEEGEGGGEAEPFDQEADPLDGMTKDELIEEAADRGIDVPATATKAEIRSMIDEG